jgi:hypothetical protein
VAGWFFFNLLSIFGLLSLPRSDETSGGTLCLVKWHRLSFCIGTERFRIGSDETTGGSDEASFFSDADQNNSDVLLKFLGGTCRSFMHGAVFIF